MSRTTSAEPKAEPAPVLVFLPAVLANLFAGAERRFPVTAATVGELVDALDSRWPGMGDRICDSSPAIRRHINIFVNGERSTLATPLAPGTDVFIFTAMSGG